VYGAGGVLTFGPIILLIEEHVPKLSLPHNQSGFTLIEIMVVVIIIAVVSVSVVSALNGRNDRAARLQADRFIAVVNEVRDEAVIEGDNFVLIVDEKTASYRFESIRSKQVSVVDVLLKNRLIDKDVTFEWDVFEALETESELAPRVLISSLGEITPFEARFKGTELSYSVTVSEEGQLERSDKDGVNF
jgi:general secretion pathway protein H